ncbi:hypothetical protein I2474_00375 [Vibrio cholerae]|uniref:hypothetical protein n=1 Tax=Vibrio TaxID=662 RepID=UPI000C7C77DF|nr:MULTISPECIES: hypothetical protein [Vibrio]AUJ35347.1 hypothetical protein BWZ32_11155 [Vibrio vulnificus]EGR0546203.1 hypothetical protein [Vibrio cholerae]EGR0574169.1 hypothetical protein [Vibrio cholerae]MBF8947264.1 hypothetical protein [Vibrio cholerae]MBF8954941.1 hypothetical protein [Vibrio cholerae]
MDMTSFEPSSAVTRFLANTGISTYKNIRRNKILRALELGKIDIDSSEVKNEEFISCYMATEHALMKASSQTKFNFLVNLFIQGANSGRLNREADAFQEVLSIVDELSERELTILYYIYQYEIEFGPMKGAAERSSFHQVEYLVNMTQLSSNLIVALIIRLRRTGLLVTHLEKTQKSDLMMAGIEIMFISPLADEIKSWVYGVIEGVFQLRES